MKKLLALLLLLAGPAQAQFVAGGNIPGGVVLGVCQISSATLITLNTACTIPFGTNWAWVESEGAAARMWGDGTVPTTSTGFALPGGSATAAAYFALAASIPNVQIIPPS